MIRDPAVIVRATLLALCIMLVDQMFLDQGAASAQLIESEAVVSDNASEISSTEVAEAEPFVLDAFVDTGIRLDELRAVAVTNSAELQKIRSLIQAAHGRACQVGLKPNPNVGFDFQQLFSNGQAEQYGVSYEQTIVRKEKLSLRQCVVLKEIQQLQQQLVTAMRKLESQVDVAYLRVLSAQRQIDVHRGLLETDQRAAAIAKSLLLADEIAETDLLQLELEVSSAEMKLLEAQTRHEGAWRGLVGLLAGPQLSPQPLAGDLFDVTDLPAYEEILEQLLNESPELAELVAKIERARTYLARQRVEPLKDISVRGLFNWQDNGANQDPNVGIAVSVPWNVNDRNQGAIHEALYLLRAAEQELEQRRNELTARLAPVYESYASAKIRSRVLSEQSIPKAEKTLEIIRRTYEQGEANFNSLLMAQRTYADLRLAQIEALEVVQIAQARIDGFLLATE